MCLNLFWLIVWLDQYFTFIKFNWVKWWIAVDFNCSLMNHIHLRVLITKNEGIYLNEHHCLNLMKISHDLILQKINWKQCNKIPNERSIPEKNNESFLLLIFCVSILRLHLACCGKSSSSMHKIHFRMRLTLTFHNIQINIHIYHGFFVRSLLCYRALAMLSLRFFSLHSRTCFSSLSFALEKYTTFSCNLHSFSLVFFFYSFSLSHSLYSVSTIFTPIHSSALTFIAHKFTMCPKRTEAARSKENNTPSTRRETNSTFFIFHARENHCARCTT